MIARLIHMTGLLGQDICTQLHNKRTLSNAGHTTLLHGGQLCPTKTLPRRHEYGEDLIDQSAGPFDPVHIQALLKHLSSELSPTTPSTAKRTFSNTQPSLLLFTANLLYLYYAPVIELGQPCCSNLSTRSKPFAHHQLPSCL